MIAKTAEVLKTVAWGIHGQMTLRNAEQRKNNPLWSLKDSLRVGDARPLTHIACLKMASNFEKFEIMKLAKHHLSYQ